VSNLEWSWEFKYWPWKEKLVGKNEKL